MAVNSDYERLKARFFPEKIQKKPFAVFLSGPMSGVPNYWEAFERADNQLTAQGYAVLSPSRLPKGLSSKQYALIYIAMIEAADAVYFLPGWEYSPSAQFERKYCKYINKPAASTLQSLKTALGGVSKNE